MPSVLQKSQEAGVTDVERATREGDGEEASEGTATRSSRSWRGVSFTQRERGAIARF